MPWVRTMLAVALTVPAIFIAFVAWELNGYVEDAGTAPAETAAFAIPWTIATVALFALAGGSLISDERRESWSRWALALAVAMAIVLAGLVVAL